MLYIHTVNTVNQFKLACENFSLDSQETRLREYLAPFSLENTIRFNFPNLTLFSPNDEQCFYVEFY